MLPELGRDLVYLAHPLSSMADDSAWHRGGACRYWVDARSICIHCMNVTVNPEVEECSKLRPWFLSIHAAERAGDLLVLKLFWAETDPFYALLTLYSVIPGGRPVLTLQTLFLHFLLLFSFISPESFIEHLLLARLDIKNVKWIKFSFCLLEFHNSMKETNHKP